MRLGAASNRTGKPLRELHPDVRAPISPCALWKTDRSRRIALVRHTEGGMAAMTAASGQPCGAVARVQHRPGCGDLRGPSSHSGRTPIECRVMSPPVFSNRSTLLVAVVLSWCLEQTDARAQKPMSAGSGPVSEAGGPVSEDSPPVSAGSEPVAGDPPVSAGSAPVSRGSRAVSPDSPPVRGQTGEPRGVPLEERIPLLQEQAPEPVPPRPEAEAGTPDLQLPPAAESADGVVGPGITGSEKRAVIEELQRQEGSER